MRNNENDYKVYKHTAPNGKVYIGITRLDVKRRWQNGTNYKTNRHFDSAIKKYGWDNIKHEIVFCGVTKREAEEKEKQLIKEYDSTNPLKGYNIESGGNAKGKVSEATRLRMSKSHIGKKYKKRRNHTEEEKRAISEKLKGRKSPMKGKHWSAEQRARVGIHIICTDTGEIFYSIRDAAQKTGCQRRGIQRVLKGEYKCTGGMHFEHYHE